MSRIVIIMLKIVFESTGAGECEEHKFLEELRSSWLFKNNSFPRS
jgi:hypothetical protein